MGYSLNWVASPNYTPGPQTQAFYGRPRSIIGGAGHWWNWPRSGANHDGIVAYMANAARQAAPHAVLSAGRVTEMVRDWDTAWCTAGANPYTFAIEIDPRIMFKWGYDNPSAAERQLGEQIFQTLCEYIADKGYANLPWKPHNVWAPGTQCNPIPYDDVMARARQIVAERSAPSVPKKDVPASQLLSEGVVKFRAKLQPTNVWDLDTNPNYQAVKQLNKGDIFEARAFIDFKAFGDQTTRYYVTQYSHENGKKVGVNQHDVEQIVEPAPTPEWQRNLVDTADVKLYVLPAAGTPVINLTTGQAIPESVIAKGTAVDIAKTTTVGGKQYLISSYAASRAMPNGILASDLGALAEPPKQEKPEWLQHLEDIEDVTMYTRAEVPLVNLLDGSTIKMLPINTPVEIATATEWGGQDYMLSKYATDKGLPHGILVAHLDKDPIKQPDTPAEPAPEQPSLEQRVSALERIVAAIKKWVKDKFNIDLGV